MALQTTSYTLAELRDRVRGDLGLRGSNLLTDGDIDDWAKQIMRIAARRYPWYRIADSVNATINVADYDLPSNAITLISLAHNDIPLPLVTLEDLEMRDPYWRSTSTGTPYLWYRRGATGYTLYPTPSATLVNGIDRTYSAIPSLPAQGSPFDFPQASEQVIIAYCLYRAALKASPGEGEGKWQNYQREYLSELEEFEGTMSDLAGEPVVMGGYATGYWRSPWDISHRVVPVPGAE